MRERTTLESFAELFHLKSEYTDQQWAEMLDADVFPPRTGELEAERKRRAFEWIVRLRSEIDEAGLRVEWQPKCPPKDGALEVGQAGEIEPRLGIACSGGGVRAATYCLGALQALTKAHEFKRARYLSAVSGGGYAAASYATVAKTSDVDVPLDGPEVAEDGDVEDGDPWIFEPETEGRVGAPEMRHLRNNSSYLLPSAGTYLWGVWRILLGLVMNLIGIALVLLAIGMPLGRMLTSEYLYPDLGGVDCRSVDVTGYLYETRGLVGDERAAVLDDKLARESAQAEAQQACEDGNIWPAEGGKAPPPVGRVPMPGAEWPLLASLLLALMPGLALISSEHPPRRRWVLRRATILGVMVAGLSVLLLIVLPFLVNLLLIPSDVALRGLESVFEVVVGWAEQFKELLVAIGIGGTAAGAAAAAGASAPKGVTKYAIYAASLIVPVMAFAALVWFASLGARGFDWILWGVATGLLVLMLRMVSARESSLHPTYRRRLTFGYRVRRATASVLKQTRPGFEDELEYHLETDDPKGPDIYGKPLPPDEGGRDLLSNYAYEGSGAFEPPELILCGTANISDVGSTPTGRHGASFTFSGREVRTAGVTIPTKELEARLSKRNRESFTLEAARAIVGAAVSPGMGKSHSKMWPFRSLLALSNIRLGVWLPNLDWVLHQSQFSARPRFHYLFREMFGLHSQRAPFVYVTDGGHWEVLGIVELLRRGCTEIYCLDASGNDQDEFAAIGKAIAIARSDLGVEINLKVESILPPKPEKPPAEGTEEPMRSPTNHLCGTITYPSTVKHPKGIKGTIVYCKAVVTDGDPADVLAYQIENPDFPSHSTGDQLFDHEQFEAYRKIGHLAGEAAAKTMKRARESGGCPDPPA